MTDAFLSDTGIFARSLARSSDRPAAVSFVSIGHTERKRQFCSIEIYDFKYSAYVGECCTQKRKKNLVLCPQKNSSLIGLWRILQRGKRGELKKMPSSVEIFLPFFFFFQHPRDRLSLSLSLRGRFVRRSRLTIWRGAACVRACVRARLGHPHHVCRL